MAGTALVAGLVFLFCWYRRKKQDEYDDDVDDQFTLSGPKQEMEQHPYSTIGGGGAGGGGGAAMLDPNPFLIAGGYNNFDTSQQQTPRQQIISNGTVTGSGGYGHNHKISSSGTSGDGNHSFGSQTDTELAFYDYNNTNNNNNTTTSPNINNNNNNTNNGVLHTNSPNPEFGRRRLSNGSLPDMIARNPGSLKVVNN